MNASQLFGWSRIGLVVGLASVAIGLGFTIVSLAWAGVGVVVLALVVNTATKIDQFRSLPLSPERRTQLAFVWVVLVVTVVGFIADGVFRQFRAGYEGYFWQLAIAAVGLVIVYQYLRRAHLPESTVIEDEDTGVPTEDE